MVECVDDPFRWIPVCAPESVAEITRKRVVEVMIALTYPISLTMRRDTVCEKSEKEVSSRSYFGGIILLANVMRKGVN